jgi:hypothetical protein
MTKAAKKIEEQKRGSVFTLHPTDAHIVGVDLPFNKEAHLIDAPFICILVWMQV